MKAQTLISFSGLALWRSSAFPKIRAEVAGLSGGEFTNKATGVKNIP